MKNLLKTILLVFVPALILATISAKEGTQWRANSTQSNSAIKMNSVEDIDWISISEKNGTFPVSPASQGFDTILVYSASHDFFSAWREDWTINPAKTYLLKVTGIFGGAGGQPEFDAAFRLASPNIPMNEFWSASFRPRRPDNDVYNLDHTYYYTLNAPDGLIWIAFADPVYGDNSGTMNLSLYELRETGNTGSFSNWKMQINTSVQSLFDQLNYAGVDTNATEGYDPALDTPNPPTPPGNYIDAYFYHPEWNSPLGAKFASDVKKSTNLSDTVKRWFFEVESNVTNQNVTLNFTGTNIPAKFGKFLTDMLTGERINLKNIDSYTYLNSSTAPRKFQLIIGDSTSPAISNLIPKGDEIWRSNTNKTVSWTMSDGTGIDSVFLYSSNNNGTNYTEFASIGNISNYNWSIPQEYLNNGYRVKTVVRDSLGNQNEIASPLAFTVVGDSLATGSPIGWSLFSTPLESYNLSKSSIFDDDITGNPYFVWGYKLSEGYNFATDINFGTGYWLGLLAHSPWDVRGLAVENDSTLQTLLTGYNIIGTKYVRPVKKNDLRFIKAGQNKSFDDAATAGWITNSIYEYSGGGYVATNQLGLFNGYWLAALVDGVEMVQKPTTTQVTDLADSNPEKQFTADNWNIKIAVESGNLVDRSLSLGVSENATIGFDTQFDSPRPPVPPAGNYVEIFSEVTGSSYPQFLGNKYAIDYRPVDAAAWNLKVKMNNQANQTVTLRWNRSALATLPDSVSVKLTDFITGSQVDMKTDSVYSFTYTGERNFVVNTTLTDINADANIPSEFVLQQNYPNPFNPGTIVRFSIPQESKVTITVYNSLGEAVGMIRNEILSSGWYESEFRADNLPSGIYFAKLEAISSNDKFVRTIKMLLLK
ncbi:MAG: T9SS type A sorting domain-containing protein [Ignavibacteria bacterium]|nr:T9SS type A sorting domain-containing protein [Ignavibacteria bacterium]